MDWSEKCPSSNFPKEIFWAKVGIWVISNLIFRSKWNEGGMDWERDWDGLDVNWDEWECILQKLENWAKMFWWKFWSFWGGLEFPKEGIEFCEGNVLMGIHQFLRRVEFPEQIAKELILRRKCSDEHFQPSDVPSIFPIKLFNFPKESFWWEINQFWGGFNFPNKL